MSRREKPRVSARERLASHMRERRRQAGISQELLAEIAGLHRTYIGAIERSERNVSIDNIEKIANALETDVANLLSPIDPKGASS
jgi:transcriptional regulator with XRE-family HTH domain